MSQADLLESLDPALQAAFARKGYTALTAVQAAVLDPELEGRDLRITSQTGSGKTVAIGLTLRALALGPCPAAKGIARPRALVIAPTRELARQVEDELAWLYSEGGGRVASATGGASYRDEHRALAAGPSVVVGTPGRLYDHLERGAIDPSAVGVVVLDEADRMLDLGFRETLEAILALLPEGHRTHLASATFPRDVQSLANRVQDDAAHVEGTRLGRPNEDISHVVHLVDARQKVDALVNLLLADREASTLVFARTRADVADIAAELNDAGFSVNALSGEMDQKARNRALATFKQGYSTVLVATDVAARGIDVQDITRVIHVDTPTSSDAYTHRSGRTGRAGRSGTSILLVSPSAMAQATRVLRQAGVQYKVEPIPTADSIRSATDARMLDELSRDQPEEAVDERVQALAEALVEGGHAARALTRLLVKARYSGAAEPRNVRVILPEASRRPERGRAATAGERGRGAPERGAPERGRGAPERGRGAPERSRDGWVPFHVSWGGAHGADARRLLALVCRRGDIRGSDVGAIDVQRGFSIVDVRADVAQAFAERASAPDPRDPRVQIRAERPGPGAAPRTLHPPPRDAAGAGTAPRGRPPAAPHPRARATGTPDTRSDRRPRSPRAETSVRERPHRRTKR